MQSAVPAFVYEPFPSLRPVRYWFVGACVLLGIYAVVVSLEAASFFIVALGAMVLLFELAVRAYWRLRKRVYRDGEVVLATIQQKWISPSGPCALLLAAYRYDGQDRVAWTFVSMALLDEIQVNDEVSIRVCPYFPAWWIPEARPGKQVH